MKKFYTILTAFIVSLVAIYAVDAYQIKQGDTLWQIAEKHDVSVQDLANYNSLANPNLIIAGEYLDIPEALVLGGTPVPTSTAARRYVEAPDTTLFTGATVSDTSITVDGLTDIYNNTLTMTSFGDKGYGRINPTGDNISEAISFTGITANADGTITLTGVSTVLAQYPYTETSGLVRAHGVGSTFRISNTAKFYDDFGNKENDAIVDGLWKFVQLPTSTVSAPTNDSQLVNKKYVDDTAFAGAPDATLTVKGIGELSTGAEAAANTAIGGGDTSAALLIYTGLTSSTAAANIIPVTGASTYLDQGFINLTDIYTWTNTHTFSSGTIMSGDLDLNAEINVSATSTLSTTTVLGTNLNVLIDGSVLATTTHSHIIGEAVTTTPTRVLGTTYQNTNSSSLMIVVSIKNAITNQEQLAQVSAYTDSAATPVTKVGTVNVYEDTNTSDNHYSTHQLTFIVAPNNYYRLLDEDSGGVSTIDTWVEYTL